MNKVVLGMLVIGGCIVIGAVMLLGMGISVSNQEVTLRTTIEKKQLDNTSEFDNLYKKISQVAQVSEKQMAVLKDIFVSHATARTGNGNDGTMMRWVQESVPNIDTSTLNNLQNILTSSRDAWTMRHKELIDLSREHTKLLRMFPSNLILSFLGRKEINITIVTSTRTEKAFETGKDDDLELFKK
jgi:hypothetical protein